MIKKDHSTGKELTSNLMLWSRTEPILPGTNPDPVYKSMKDRILLGIAEYQRNGSGWQFARVIALYITISKYRPLKGGCDGTTLPKALESRKATLNMKYRSRRKGVEIKKVPKDECFKYAVGRALNPVERIPVK